MGRPAGKKAASKVQEVTPKGGEKFPHLSEIEKGYIIALVKKHQKTIENKKTNKVFNSAKEAAWLQIETEFNANTDVTRRDAKNLKKSWENLKARAKKEFSAERVSFYKTGGGSQDEVVSPSSQSKKVHEVVSSQIDPLVNEFDDDFIPPEKSNSQDQHQTPEFSFGHLGASNTSNSSESENESTKENENSTSQSLEREQHGPTHALSESQPPANIDTEVTPLNKDDSTKSKKRKRSKDDDLLDMERIEHDLRCEQIREKIFQQKEKHERELQLIEAQLLYWKKKEENVMLL